jgi:hypothetical protein
MMRPIVRVWLHELRQPERVMLRVRRLIEQRVMIGERRGI